ncbi:nitrate reductase cytochrome c-type subunit [Magnetofaba australis]|uniref:Periplasmic nitrate reductase, electron transfer subunit n=1 Tax=Magnetofaba australis IT-1 TaxID=1434232 RepID=A0A1Y2K7M7_9PROT|nr:nitrate reductase cytochrome c-type subunit [Magnetofaba australis]OSM06185.1 putative periplasmic nitrate reductase subunit NapB [Magnetofaba australis IT-1]
MKKSILFGLTLAIGLLGVALTTVQAGTVQSLRGDAAINDSSNSAMITHYNKDGAPIPRDYLQQPPLIPHSVEGYQVNLKFNKCLSCHSWKNYRDHNATKISQTHFESRDGAIMANVSPRRYFCPQCHVPQTDAKPLVQNEFKPVDALKIQ